MYISTRTPNLSFSFWQQSRTQFLKSSGVMSGYSSTSICLRKTSNTSLKFDETYKTYLYIYIFISCCRLLYIFRCTLFYLTKEIHFTYILHHPFVLCQNHISKSSMGFDFGQYRGIATKYKTAEIHDLHKSHNLYLTNVHRLCRNY